ncbi:hypothetical protein GOP47_0004831 [Adiantum capillus-veneris]|uniref:Transmembrane protein 53 n=1 Tax=Adiantum capillus-veneris TaxID=13818 RepID=A0A9D4V4R3_ADICA|nr:hypothetical protein GOP47_0004831 [Adiantum capillus-veneris]
MATFSASSDLPDKSCLRSFTSVMGQTLLLSSRYAPTSFEFGFSLPDSPPMESLACGQPPLPSATHIIPFSPFTSQSSAVRFYKPESTISLGQIYRQGVVRPIQEVYHLTKNFPCMTYRPLLDAVSAHISPSDAIAHLRWRNWKHPMMAHNWHALIAGQHRMVTDFSLPRLPHMFHFEKLHALLYGAYSNPPMASTSLLHMWQGPVQNPDSDDGEKPPVKQKPLVAVVLLGWLGAEHRHLKRYADWYTSRGIHAVTFVVPMKDLLTLKAGDRAEKHVDVLTQNLVQWFNEDASGGNDEKIVIFHTFSNTGWLTYGAVLERLISQGDDLLDRIKGCVVDSAPSARPDPHVWASGFSAALLKKGSVATQMLQSCGADDWNGAISQPKPSFKETALLAMLENFFSVFLQIPYVSRRLKDVVSVLASQQPACPQLYIYSSADIVIPAKSVESFIEEQRKAGHMVKACNFQCSPHVDHFRTFPDKYSELLTSFLKLCVPQWAAQ